MYILMIAIIIAVISAAIIWIVQGYFDNCVVITLLGMAVVGFFVGLLTYNSAYEIALRGETLERHEEVIELIPVSDTVGEYTRVVGADELKYLYSYKIEDDSIQKSTIEINNVTIKYISNNEKPRFVKATYFFTNKFKNWLFSYAKEADYIFYVPEGSVIN